MYKVKVNQNIALEVNASLTQITSTNEVVGVVKNADNSFGVIIDGTHFIADIINIDEETKTAKVRINQNTYTIAIQTAADIMVEKLGIQINKPKKANQLISPMPGLILKILVAVGDVVKKGDSLLILEAMKMENVFKAPADAIIEAIKITEKEAVEKGQTLIQFN